MFIQNVRLVTLHYSPYLGLLITLMKIQAARLLLGQIILT